MHKEKVLIIKLGYSETLDGEIGMITSLGDVLRSTVLLHLYKNAHVTWLVDEKAFLLLKGNPFIHRILSYDLTSVLQLQSERFDTVINLEKVPGVCAFSDSINAWRRYGFRFDPEKGVALAYDGSQHVLEICMYQEYKKKTKKHWEEILFEMVGAKWQGEGCILGYKPQSSVMYDIGFNYDVGKKWPNKAWPMEYWKELEKLIGNKYTISWQQGLKNIEEYFEWINSCNVFVTNDSLGLHIASALNKKTIALFGPTLASEIYVQNGIKLLPQIDYSCIPCLSPRCTQSKPCMNYIAPMMIYDTIKKIIKG
ncbi:MAG: glycosyltransferase family 9 protein [Candidatus Paceibacter sp.]|nr:glycosyltransferase family 9 protein [Candidatus Paceibacter sp.]